MGLTSDELLIRWMQFGVFNSHVRIHGAGNREIYKFRPETERICRDYLRLRYRLLPYIYGSAMKCVEESLPITINVGLPGPALPAETQRPLELDPAWVAERAAKQAAANQPAPQPSRLGVVVAIVLIAIVAAIVVWIVRR